MFKNTDILIAFKANNTIYQQLAQKAENRHPSGIYEIQCNTCGKNYVGQSGRPITIRHKEHIRYIKTNNPASAYATYILNNRHEYGTANDTLKLIHPCRKSKKMNHGENMYIQIHRQQNLLIMEQQVNEPNPLYELAQLPHAIRDSSHRQVRRTHIHIGKSITHPSYASFFLSYLDKHSHGIISNANIVFHATYRHIPDR